MSMLEGFCILLTVSEHPVLQSQALQVLDHGESVGDLLHTAETNVPHPADVDVKTESEINIIYLKSWTFNGLFSETMILCFKDS